MPKRTHTDPRHARQRCQSALARGELRATTTPRQPSAGVTSFAIKATDPVTKAMVEEFLARKR